MDKDHTYLLGKDSDVCDIVFNDLSVSKEHAEITINSEGNIFIEDLSSTNGTIVNSKKIEQKTVISPKDIIFLGTTAFIIIDPKDAGNTIYSPLPSPKEEEKKEEPVPEAEETPEEAFGELEWKKQIIPKKHLVVAGCFIISLFIIFLTTTNFPELHFPTIRQAASFF